MEGLAYQNWAITLKPREEIMLTLDKPYTAVYKKENNSQEAFKSCTETHSDISGPESGEILRMT